MKKLLILLCVLAIAGMAFADVIIGTGTSTGYYPGSTYYNYYRSAAVFTAAELAAGSGTITALQWYCGTANTTTPIPFKIYMKTTANVTLAANTWALESAGATEVFNASVTVNATGWFNFDITDTPYTAGTNLEVLVETGSASYVSPYVKWNYTTTTPTYKMIATYADTTIPTSLTTNYLRPNIKFVGITSTVFPEPTNHVTGFAAGTLNYTTIQLNWTGATGAQLPGNYLIQAIKGAGTYAAVGDGVPVANDAVWTDNNAATNVAHVVGANTYTFTGLTPNTAYEFKIWPYTNSLTAINFKTDGIIPTVNASTLDPTVSTYPWLVDFGTLTTDWLPANWAKYSGVLASPSVLTAASGSWYQDDWLNVTSPLNKAAKVNIYGTTAAGNWIVSPPIVMPGAGYQLEFDLAYMAWNSLGTAPVADGTGDRFEVLIGDGTTWTPANIVRSWDNAASPYVLNNVSPAGEHITLDVSGVTGTKYIAFYIHNGDVGDRDNDFMLDNVLLRETPAGAPDPVTLGSPAAEATGLAKNGFNFTWTPAITGGEADDFTIFISTDEFDVLSQFSATTGGTSLNPVGMPYESGTFAFTYEQRYYWQVFANGAGEEIGSDVRWFEIEADPSITLPHTQSFDDLAIPAGWTQTYSGTVTSNRWTASATTNAGGTANEMMETWASGVGITRLISPPIVTDGYGSVAVNFNTLYDDYGTGVTARVQYSHDLVTWYNTGWSAVGGGGNVGPGNYTTLITGLSAPVTYIAWAMDGDHYQFDYWYVDNVLLSAPLDHDVGIVSIDMAEVVPAVAMNPKATIINNGANTETFNVTMTIGANYSSTKEVTAITSGNSTQVVFDAITPVIFTAEDVDVTCLLATDENTANDAQTGVLVCLPLDVQAYADVAYDPGSVNDGPATFNLATPGTITDLTAATPWSGYFLAGADWMNGGWYGKQYVDSASSPFWQIDEVTGDGTLLGTGTVVMSGFAYDEVNDIRYATDGTSLYTLDAVGISTLIGALHFTGETSWVGLMIGIAYDSYSGTLYGVDLGYDWLISINVTTAECTDIGGGLGIDLNYAQDCAFDRENGLLYMAGYTANGALYWIDTIGGGAYKVGDFQSGSEVTGFAIPYGSAVPEAPVVTIGADGTLSWPAVDGAAVYKIYASDDPYGTFTLLDSTTSLTWLDPAFGVAKMFYQVKADNAAPAKSVASVRQSVRGHLRNDRQVRSLDRNVSAGLRPTRK